MPFLSIHPAAANLTAALGPAAAALNVAAGAAEAALGRRLFAFQLEAAALPACGTGTGPCAVWEASSGRVVLDATLAGRMAALAGRGAPPAGSGSGGGRSSGRSSRSMGLGRGPHAGSSAGLGSGGSSSAEAGSDAGLELPALLAAFVDKMLEQVAGATALLQSGRVSWASGGGRWRTRPG